MPAAARDPMHRWSLLVFLPIAACGGTSIAPLDAGSAPEKDGAPSAAPEAGASDSGSTSEEPGPTSTAGVSCGYSYSGFNDSPSVMMTSTVQWTCTATTRSVTANGIPDHAVGTFPNPQLPQHHLGAERRGDVDAFTRRDRDRDEPRHGRRGLRAQRREGSIPGPPARARTRGSSVSCSLIGDTGSWNIEALGQTSFNFGVDSEQRPRAAHGRVPLSRHAGGGAHEARQGSHDADAGGLRARRLPGLRALRLHDARRTRPRR